MVIVRILTSKFGFKEKKLVKLIAGVVKHATINSNRNSYTTYTYTYTTGGVLRCTSYELRPTRTRGGLTLVTL
jgi:hypothetical protein